MAEIPFIPTPLSSTPQRKAPALIIFGIGVVFFVAIAGVSAYVTLTLFGKSLPQLSQRQPTTIQINRLIDPCLLYFKACDTSYDGVTSQDSLSKMLNFAESPILQRPPVDFVQKDSLVIQLPAASVLTTIASDQDINPFLLATLSEIEYGTFFQKTVSVNDTIQNAGIVKTAFMGQHLNMAQALKQEITAQALTPDTPPTSVNQYTSEKFGVRIELQNGSTADVVVLKYLENHATTADQFVQMVTDFIPTYQVIASLNPDTTEKNLKQEFIPTPTSPAGDTPEVPTATTSSIPTATSSGQDQ